MTASPARTDRTTTILIAASGVALFGYLALRPWAAGDTAAGWADPRWPLSHLLAVAGFVAYAALGARLTGRLGRILSGAALALLLPYYGAEAFALPALHGLAPEQAQAIAQAFRYGPIPMVTFGLGWVALGWLAVLTARALRSPERLGRIAVILHTAAMLAWLPVFFLPAAGRLAHAALVGTTALVIALRAPQPTASPAPAVA
ncbi:MAG: hypothetical protein Q4F67_11310 [Propionibacteriaceae bacterium]|nr:hypothetical protein [Propionibacteriaceae bacterium]